MRVFDIIYTITDITNSIFWYINSFFFNLDFLVLLIQITYITKSNIYIYINELAMSSIRVSDISQLN